MKHKNLEKCNKCGICNMNCPVYMTLRTETVSPRNKVKMASEGKISHIFFDCVSNECDCFKNCPVGIKLDVVSLREKMNREGLAKEENEQMRINIIKFGNPFGEPGKVKNIKKYYT